MDKRGEFDVEAAKAALADANIFASHIDLIHRCHCHSRSLFPSTACQVQHAIGSLTAAAFGLTGVARALLGEKNNLLQYFEQGPLAGPDLKELRHLWQRRSKTREREMLHLLTQFAQSHPHPTTTQPSTIAPERKEELECIAWMLITDG